jgi:outer membrane protein assembly factor BamD (BamD/ComL family)
MLADANTLATAGSYPEAVKSLRDLYTGLPGLAVAAKAKKQLSDLLAKPEAKAALAKADQDARDAERNAAATSALSIAQKLQSDKKDQQAWEKYKSIAADYAGTDAANLAAEQVKTYNKAHPEFAANAKESAAGAKAKAALTLANSYRESGRTDLARSKYKSVIASYPNTSYAETAKRELETLGN